MTLEFELRRSEYVEGRRALVRARRWLITGALAWIVVCLVSGAWVVYERMEDPAGYLVTSVSVAMLLYLFWGLPALYRAEWQHDRSLRVPVYLRLSERGLYFCRTRVRAPSDWAALHRFAPVARVPRV